MLTPIRKEPNEPADAFSAAHTDPSSQALTISRKYAALSPERRRRFREKAREQGIDPARLPIVPLSHGADAVDEAPAIAVSAAELATYPLAPAQERLWFLWKLDPLNPAYNLSRALRLTGRLDVRALRRAFDALVARHGALRTRFVETRGVVAQCIADETHYLWREHALHDPAQLRDLLRTVAREPFDLVQGPLLRVDLVAIDVDCYALSVGVHHIVSDGWSQALLVRDLAALYRAALTGEDAALARALPPLDLHFGDVAAWQNEWQEGALADDLAYWTKRLSIGRPTLELPLDRPRAAMRGIEGGRVRRDVGAALADCLRGLARTRRTTLFTVLLAAYAALLYRYGGQSGVRIGVPSAGRQRSETAGLIGFFVNTLVIDVDVDGGMQCATLLSQLHARVLEAHAHQAAPFGRILDALRIERDLGRSPLFQVMFNLEQATSEASVAMPGLVVEPEAGGTDTARFDLVLNVVDDGHSLRLMFNYAADVFDASTVERIASQYEAVLTQMAEGVQQRVGALKLPMQREAKPLQKYPFESLGMALAAQARRTPQALALCCEDASLTYAQLDVWSSTLAARLIARGVGAERRVGLCVARGPALIAALVGIIRSGGAFVPLDPEYPAARLAQMIDDAGIVQVVADASSAGRVAGVLAQCEVVDVGSMAGVVALGSPADAARHTDLTLHPEQLAYVLYTSGSTGRPKGVAVSHGALWTHLQDFLATYGINEADTVLHSSTINFDVALHETLPALLRGATVEMRGVQPWDLQTLSERLVTRRVTFARIPTALWQQWQRPAPPREQLALRQVTVGGEALPGDALARWRDGPLADIRLDNLYGPTETTVAALYRRTEAADVNQVTVPIGRPYPGRTARVLDTFGDEAPVGGLGELCIGGPTVARGYLGRAGLTAERFVPDPYGEPGARVYRSGDLCRMRADGTVEFLGRLDQQVKLRGQRIELGEIEAVLRQCEGVREAAVMVVGEGQQQRLAAYVAVGGEIADASAAAAPTPDAAHLQRELEQKLPGYMVPSSVTVLARLPWMPNGKLDRAALPAPQAEARERVAPSNEVESALLSIWSAVLGRDDLGVTENFFEAGGDSIQSLQIIARAREAGWRLTPRQIFEHPTVAALAQRAQRLDAPGAHAPDDGAALGLTPIQRLFFERYPHGESHWNQAVLLKVKGRLVPEALERAVAALEARHDALRLRFVQEAGAWQQVADAAHTSPTPQTAVVRHETPGSLADLKAACERIQSSLDIVQGPVWRVGHFETPDETRVLIAIHHLSVDGVSWRVLLEELQSAYEQAERAEPIQLPAPSMPWRAWVRALHEYAESSERVAELAWWQTILDAPALQAGPLFQALAPKPQPQKTLLKKLSRQLTVSLVREAPRAYRMRVDEVLLAALARAVGDRVSRDEVLIELEGHGREDVIDGVDLSRTVGWFTTQYPLALPRGTHAADALLRVRERLAAVPLRGLGWGLLACCADAASRSALRALPTPEIAFNYLGRFDQTFDPTSRFGFATEASGDAIAPRAKLPDRALDINVWIAGDSLALNWGYAPQFISDALAEQLFASFESALGDLVAHLRTAMPEAEAPAPRRPVPEPLERLARHDAVAASWTARAVYEASLPVPSADALAAWFARRRPQAAPARALAAPSAAVPLNALGAPTTLFCLHPGYGMVGEYRTLAQALNGRVSLIAIQAPALRGEPWQGNTFEALAAHYADCIETLQPHGDYALLGWSFGGRLAIAIADHAERRGEGVSFVGIVDTATHREEGAGSADANRVAADDTAPASALALLEEAQPSLLGDALAADALHASLMARHALPRIGCDLHVWRALRVGDSRRRMAWAEHTRGRLHQFDVDASHSSIVHHPLLAMQLAQCFAQALPRGREGERVSAP
ncbi:non-ribosomal peptide synthetase [Paraburkholderia phenoliruptrix]|uniref:non-ribosomal peptide synthetase n=1 Tax=Paraburkholderia phenoliruptrix TaxID=252970 RepID=UPI0015919ECC|nr:non-ribosomal peptide synthetase [Paraburkholderia phenoliruptrix]